MGIAKLTFAAFALIAAALPEQAQQVTVAASAAKPAIKRILEADNLDVEALPAREVAERMGDIRQGAAPAEFWTAYRAHVRAWQDYAHAKELVRNADPLTGPSLDDAGEIVAARSRINRTFDDVEAIAKRYDAWPPRTQTRL